MNGILINLPNEILEHIRQYIGNCRIWQGQLIKTINKNSTEFKIIEELIEGNCRLGRFVTNQLPEKQNWHYYRYWNTSPNERVTSGIYGFWQTRMIEKRYKVKTDTLTFRYVRKKIKRNKKNKIKDHLKKNMDITTVIY